MTTITIPRSDFVQRADDEGRDYYAFRTVKAAADLWVEEDKTTRAWQYVGPTDDEGAVVFADSDDPNSNTDMTITIAASDEDMDDLYPAADLPFTITIRLFEVGDYIAHEPKISGTTWRVDSIDTTGYNLTSMSTGNPGSIAFSHTSYRKVPAPTATYTVTVRADHTLATVRDHLMDLGGPVTVTTA